MIEPGAIIGEIAFFDGGLRTASAMAAEVTTCFALDREPFFELMLHHPELPVHLLKLVCERVRFTSQQVIDSAFLSVAARLALRLIQLPRITCGNSFEVRVSQAELAGFLSVSRQVVNRYLRRWQQGGVVSLGRGHVVVKNLAQLRSVAEQQQK
jgi:CRP-like cAMP-binding protein